MKTPGRAANENAGEGSDAFPGISFGSTKEKAEAARLRLFVNHEKKIGYRTQSRIARTRARTIIRAKLTGHRPSRLKA